MTRDDAIRIRAAQLQGARVDPAKLAEAIEVIKTTNQPLTDSDVTGLHRKGVVEKKAGTKKPRKPRTPKPQELVELQGPQEMVIPILTKENPTEVVKALKPWALPAEVGHPENPEGYVWPFPGDGVDIDRVHRKGTD